VVKQGCLLFVLYQITEPSCHLSFSPVCSLLYCVAKILVHCVVYTTYTKCQSVCQPLIWLYDIRSPSASNSDCTCLNTDSELGRVLLTNRNTCEVRLFCKIQNVCSQSHSSNTNCAVQQTICAHTTYRYEKKPTPGLRMSNLKSALSLVSYKRI
jgi:hypothetical protein